MNVERKIERSGGGRSPEPGELTEVKARLADIEDRLGYSVDKVHWHG